jgi:hypothetical protein
MTHTTSKTHGILLELHPSASTETKPSPGKGILNV